MSMMNSRELKTEAVYQGTMHTARKMVEAGIITAEEYAEAEAALTEKYHPVFGVLFSSLYLDFQGTKSDV